MEKENANNVLMDIEYLILIVKFVLRKLTDVLYMLQIYVNNVKLDIHQEIVVNVQLDLDNLILMNKTVLL